MNFGRRLLIVFGVVLVNVQVISCMNTARCTPPTEVNCETIIEYMRCNEYKIQDCIYIQQSDSYMWRIDDQLSWNYGLSACRLIPNGDMASVQNFEELSAVSELDSVYGFSGTTMLWLGMRCNLKDSTTPTCNQSNLLWSDGSSTDYLFGRNQQYQSTIQASRDSCMQIMPSSSFNYFNFLACGSSSAATICKAQSSGAQQSSAAIKSQGNKGELPSACDRVLEHFRRLSIPVYDCLVNDHTNRVYWRMDRYSMSDTGNNNGWQYAKTFCRSMPESEMVTLHDFDDWRSAATLAKMNQMGSPYILFGLIADGTTRTVRWIDGTPFDYNNTQMPINIPSNPGVDYCGYMMGSGPYPSSMYQVTQCNQTYSQGSALCFLPVGQQKKIQRNDLSKEMNSDNPKACPQPNQPLTCDAVISYLTCLNYKAFDCTELNGKVYYKINSLPQNFDIAEQACKMVTGGDAISVHNSEEAYLGRWMGCSGYGTGSIQAFIGLKCGAPKCRPESLVWSDGSTYDYKVVNEAFLNSNDTSNHCFVNTCISMMFPTACVSNSNTGGMSIICKAAINNQKKQI